MLPNNFYFTYFYSFCAGNHNKYIINISGYFNNLIIAGFFFLETELEKKSDAGPFRFSQVLYLKRRKGQLHQY